MDKAIDFLDPIDTDVPKGGEAIMNRAVKTKAHQIYKAESMLLLYKHLEKMNRDGFMAWHTCKLLFSPFDSIAFEANY